MDNVSIVPAGNVAEFLPQSIGATKWLDTSGNENHGAVTGATQTHKNIFGGNVGIGTATPASPLHIHSSGNISQYITSASNVNDSASTALWFAHNYPTSGDWAGIIFDADDKLRIVNSGSSNDSHLVITDAGKVGIGTDSPTTELVVANNGSTSDTAAISIISGNAGNSYLNFGDAEDDNRGFINYQQSDDKMMFRTAGSGTDVTIDSAGNVGIGTTTPASVLHLATSASPAQGNDWAEMLLVMV